MPFALGHSHDNGAESEHSDPEIKGSQNQIMEGTAEPFAGLKKHDKILLSNTYNFTA